MLKRIFWTGLLFILSASSGVSAEPAKRAPQTMTYAVYAGGVNVLSAALTVDASQKAAYHLSLSARTHGLLGRLAPWQGVFETDGAAHADGTLRPARHQSRTLGRDEREVTTFRYNPDGSFRDYSLDNEEKEGAQPYDPALSADTTDVLSATLAVMDKVAAGQPCAGESDVFDGDRRYTLIYRDEGSVHLEKSRLNRYEGPARQCTIEVRPKGGKWHEKPRGWLSIQEQGRAQGTMPTIWLATLKQGEPAVPVRLRVKTDYGTLFLHLTSYRGD